MARIDYRLELKAAGHGNDLDVRIRVSCCQQSSKRGGVAEGLRCGFRAKREELPRHNLAQNNNHVTLCQSKLIRIP